MWCFSIWPNSDAPSNLSNPTKEEEKNRTATQFNRAGGRRGKTRRGESPTPLLAHWRKAPTTQWHSAGKSPCIHQHNFGVASRHRKNLWSWEGKVASASRPEHRHFLSRKEARTHRSPPVPDVVCCAPPQTSCAAFGVLKCLKPTLSIKSLHDFRRGVSENPFRCSPSRDFVVVGIKANLCLWCNFHFDVFASSSRAAPSIVHFLPECSGCKKIRLPSALMRSEKLLWERFRLMVLGGWEHARPRRAAEGGKLSTQLNGREPQPTANFLASRQAPPWRSLLCCALPIFQRQFEHSRRCYLSPHEAR